MQNTNVTVADQNAVINSNVALFDSQYLNAISAFAQIMAQGAATVPRHLQGNQADCMAVAMQAAQWQMNPFAVAQKTHLINGVLGYEAQLVNAVISRSGVLANRFEYEWYGPWEKVVGKFQIRKGDKGEYRVPGWTLADETGIGIIIRATLKGEDQPMELDLLLAQARTRNSTLWADDPRQQLAYLAVKRWARLFCPDVILGVYTLMNWMIAVKSEKLTQLQCNTLACLKFQVTPSQPRRARRNRQQISTHWLMISASASRQHRMLIAPKHCVLISKARRPRSDLPCSPS